MTDYYDESIGSRHIGFECIGDQFLNNEMRDSGKRRKCFYCGTVARGFTVKGVAERVETAFDIFYSRTADEMDGFEYNMHRDPEIEYDWERKGDPVIDVISETLKAEPEIAEDVRQVLDDKYGNWDPSDPQEETEFHRDSYYTEIDLSDEAWQQEWRKFEQGLRSESRYFNYEGAKHLMEVFAGIQEMRTFDRRSIVRLIGPDTDLNFVFRARVFQSDDKLTGALKKPELHLGPPPSAFANGRMNARGISVFYGAMDQETALAEVRPPVGSQVLVGTFSLTRPLKVLDLSALTDVRLTGSIFDPAYANELARITFLSNLAAMLTQPVMPDDELFNYLPTQAIADFLATEPAFDFDGIIFKSAQVEGGKQNIVLFHKASRVEDIPVPQGTEFDVHLWEYACEEVYRSYQVMENEPEPAAAVEKPKDPNLALVYQVIGELDAPEKRPVSLKLIPDSLKVHVIKAVKIVTEAHEVLRFRFPYRPVADD